MTQEEFEQVQAALVASMNQDEEIHIGDDEEDGSGNQGIFQQAMGMFGFSQ